MAELVSAGSGADGAPRALVDTGQQIEPVEEAGYAPDLAKLKKLFSDAREHSLDARRNSQVDCDYYDDKQWTSDEIKVLNKRKQPQVWTNRIKPAVNGLLGVIEQGQGDPRGFPRTNADEEASEACTDSLRYAADTARWPRTKIDAAADYLKAGTAAVIVEVDEELNPFPRHIDWEEFFVDPHRKRRDHKDARYMGVAKWMYADLVEATFELAGPIDVDSLSGAGGMVIDEGDQDKPEIATSWGDKKRRRVLVVEMYWDDGGWKRCVFYGGDVLEAGDSPYVDEKGRPTNPIEAQACYINRDKEAYGIVRSWRPIQDAINMRESKLLHLVNSRVVKQSAIDALDVPIETVRNEAARPDGVIPYGYDVVVATDMASGQAQLLANSKAEMDRAGPSPDVLGRQSASSSGRAQLVRQEAGLTELMPALGGLEDLELRVYRQMWARIRQFWTAPKMVRVTDDIGAPKFLTVNEPVIQGEKPIIDPQTGQPVFDPVTRQIRMEPNVVGVKNRPAEMDMDIIIESTPDTVTVQQEQFASLMELAKIYGPQEVTFDDALMLSSMPGKRELMDRRKARQQQTQGQKPQSNPLMDAKARNLDASTELNLAKAYKTVSEAAGVAGTPTPLTRPAPPPQPVQPGPQGSGPIPPPGAF